MPPEFFSECSIYYYPSIANTLELRQEHMDAGGFEGRKMSHVVAVAHLGRSQKALRTPLSPTRYDHVRVRPNGSVIPVLRHYQQNNLLSSKDVLKEYVYTAVRIARASDTHQEAPVQTLSPEQKDSRQGEFYAIWAQWAAVSHSFDPMTCKYTAISTLEKNALHSVLATPIICGRRSADFWPSF